MEDLTKQIHKDEWNCFVPLTKVDAAKQEVWGVVTAEYPDRDKEICDYESTVPYYKALVKEMTKASDGKNIFPLRAMHGLISAGKGISIEFRNDKKEIYCGFKVVDANEWLKVSEGCYTGFSQGGKFVKRWKDGDYVRYTANPIEASLVDVPCLPEAVFDYVKTDGTVEIRKFATSKISDMTRLERNMSLFIKGANCTCKCDKCIEGKCASCTAETKCNMAASAGKAVKYLVVANGEKHLPYTNADGSPNHRLMGAAWAALHGGYRGNKYEGPNKEQAKKKLKQLYAAQGLDTPTEKGAVIEVALKSMLEDNIQGRAFGQLGKGLYTVSRFADILESMKYLWLSLEYEREQEGDESPVTDDLKETFSNMLDHMLTYCEEQISEEKIKMHEKVFKSSLNELELV